MKLSSWLLIGIISRKSDNKWRKSETKHLVMRTAQSVKLKKYKHWRNNLLFFENNHLNCSKKLMKNKGLFTHLKQGSMS